MRPMMLGRNWGIWLRAAAAVGALFAIVLLHPPAAHAARGIDLGFYDGDFTSSDTSTQTTAFDRAAKARPGVTLIYVDWSRVAPNHPNRPGGFDAADPSDPHYNWTSIDDAVVDA